MVNNPTPSKKKTKPWFSSGMKSEHIEVPIFPPTLFGQIATPFPSLTDDG
jgi:hypothetical protein